jgi:hypothetical protein
MSQGTQNLVLEPWARQRRPTASLPPASPLLSGERHYTPAEVAGMWKLSIDMVRRLFEGESGVLVIRNGGLTQRKRRYRTLRIPQSVVDRVHRRLSIAGGRN